MLIRVIVVHDFFAIQEAPSQRTRVANVVNLNDAGKRRQPCVAGRLDKEKRNERAVNR